MTTTDDLMQALQQAEQTGNVDPMVALHAPNVLLRNLSAQTWKGQDGARAFWEAYLGAFERIRSEFTRSQENGGLDVMEWEATGQVKGGHDLAYRGVSLIDIEGRQVKTFRTYYDSAAFVGPVSS